MSDVWNKARNRCIETPNKVWLYGGNHKMESSYKHGGKKMTEKTRGGSRPGCGRKPVHPGIKRVQTTISVSQKTRERIRILAKNKNIRIGRVIDRVVEELYNKHCNEEIGNI